MQLFIWFFGLPRFGITLPAFVCGVVGLGMYSGAYVSEIVRGAIQSVDRGQTEAARSLGMSSGQAMRIIILPQAVVRMIPPLGNEFIALIKNSALVSLLTIHDLMHEGQKIISVSYGAGNLSGGGAGLSGPDHGGHGDSAQDRATSARRGWCNEHRNHE